MTATESNETTTDTPKPWHLRENRAPVFDEVTLTELEVKGAIPPELEGRYVRNGANPRTGESAHWFLGDGMLHGIELSGGKANWYKNRYVRTKCYENPGVERAITLRSTSSFTGILRTWTLRISSRPRTSGRGTTTCRARTRPPPGSTS